MKQGKDISVEFGELYLVHQNVPGKRHANVSYPSFILFVPLQGEIKVEVSKKKFSVGAGHMLFIPAETVHSFDSSVSSGERLIAMVQSKSSFLKTLGAFETTVLPLSQLIKEILFYLLLHPKTSNGKSLVSVFVETLAESLAGQAKSSALSTDHLQGKISDSRIRNALIFMKDNISEKISIEDIAKQSGLSARNLNRLMLNEMGLTLKQILISIRIEKAQELLEKSNMPVTDVAFDVGYSSLSQFIAAFRAQTGQLPSEAARFGRKPKI